jgi:hypothetical protein
MLILRFSMEKLHNKPTCLGISKWEREREALTSLNCFQRDFLTAKLLNKQKLLRITMLERKREALKAWNRFQRDFLVVL